MAETKKKPEKSTVVTITILGLIMLLSLVTAVRMQIAAGNITSVLQIPTVIAGVPSSEDGELHNVVADFIVEVQGDGTTVSVEDVQSKLANLMSTLDYEQMKTTGSTSYIVSSLEFQLSEYFAGAKITGLYVTDLAYDGVDVSSGVPQPTSHKKDTDTFRALFGN